MVLQVLECVKYRLRNVRWLDAYLVEVRICMTAKARQVLGNPGLAGRNVRLQAGELLKVIDLCAASSAMQHAGHPTCPTLAFDRVELLVPCCHGDLVHMDSRVVSVGNSTMVIQVLGRKRDVLSRQWVFTHEAFATFVSLGSDRRPAGVPDLEVQTEEEEAMRHYIQTRQEKTKKYQEEQRHREEHCSMSVEQIEAVSTKHRDNITMKESTIRLRKNFLPRNLNGIGTIFGGDLLAWMEGAAVLCASNFTRNSNVVTIAMDRVFFKTAIQVHHVLELTARVVYCRKHTVQVETTVTAILPEWAGAQRDDDFGGQAPPPQTTFSHTGYFTILNMTDYGHKKPLGVALDIRGDSEAQAAYLKADHRFRFSLSAVSPSARISARRALAFAFSIHTQVHMLLPPWNGITYTLTAGPALASRPSPAESGPRCSSWCLHEIGWFVLVVVACLLPRASCRLCPESSTPDFRLAKTVCFSLVYSSSVADNVAIIRLALVLAPTLQMTEAQLTNIAYSTRPPWHHT